MSNPKPLPSIERLREVFAVTAEGDLIWTKRPHKGSAIKLNTPVRNVDNCGYYRVKLDKENYKVHRIVWAIVNGRDPGLLQIDHINRDRTDNRPENLRLATSHQNMRNRIARPHGETGELHIYRCPPRCKLKPYVVGVRRQYLGTFATIDEAKSARDKYLDATRSEYDPQ